jgi:hypothetical protein
MRGGLRADGGGSLALIVLIFVLVIDLGAFSLIDLIEIEEGHNI